MKHQKAMDKLFDFEQAVSDYRYAVYLKIQKKVESKKHCA